MEREASRITLNSSLSELAPAVPCWELGAEIPIPGHLTQVQELCLQWSQLQPALFNHPVMDCKCLFSFLLYVGQQCTRSVSKSMFVGDQAIQTFCFRFWKVWIVGVNIALISDGVCKMSSKQNWLLVNPTKGKWAADVTSIRDMQQNNNNSNYNLEFLGFLYIGPHKIAISPIVSNSKYYSN